MAENKFFVVDTNTLISAAFDLESTAGKVLLLAREKGYLITSDEIIKEYLNVFSRPKFDKWISIQTRFMFIENIIENSIRVKVTQNVNVCRDPKDDMYLILALSAEASCIISGDKDLLVLHPFQGIPILNAANFLASQFS